MATSTKGRYVTVDSTISAWDAAAVTPDDSTILPITRGLYVGSTGAVAVKMWSGNTVTFSAVPAGKILPVQVQQVLATGTTASAILALY